MVEDSFQERQVNVALNSNVPALAIDAASAYVVIDPEYKPRKVQLLGIQVSPIVEPDGSMKGSVISRWVMDPEDARTLAIEIMTKLDQVASMGGKDSDGGSSDPNHGR